MRLFNQVKCVSMIALCAIFLFSAIAGSPSAYAEKVSAIQAFIDGKLLETNKPVIVEGRKRYLPMRAALEQMGWKVDWSPDLIRITYETPGDSTTHYLYLEEESEIRFVEHTAYIEMYYLGDLTESELTWNDESFSIHIRTTEQGAKDLEEGSEEDLEETAHQKLSAEERVKANYGKYEASPTLQSLIELYGELEKEGYNADNALGFYPSTDQLGYFNTPLDVIPFGWTGMDGDHYGFLTEFGTVSNLEEAPIVMVSPMSFDQPAFVVANNIREFLRIVMLDSSLLVAEYDNEEQYLEEMAAFEEEYDYEETDAERKNNRMVRESLEAKLHPPAIGDPYTYSKKVRAERAKRIIVPTQDQLGVTNVHPDDAGKKHTSIVLDEYIGRKELESFLSTATYASKLALFRDYHFNLDDFIYREDGIDDMIVNEMKRMALNDELVRMNVNRFSDDEYEEEAEGEAETSVVIWSE
ncbi:hypothetical protein [Paenibacillus sp. NEAU-GSW1]|uniref:hypothetical protein n=1 Tax=Paenibacillus sp. NEAU-GSW1 TaxID=2682486 RepID=UPI0012E0ED07|nr:hypothetical protein [Paenibacillus sp. NEAU-GSW1]MUT64675.1 hypothetical protein [Paenibacillus sp. NEAU-GSW1]